jgi:hypothetical protein
MENANKQHPKTGDTDLSSGLVLKDSHLSVSSDGICDTSMPLLPCELNLERQLRVFSGAQTAEDRNAAVIAILRQHPFVEVKGRPGVGGHDFDFGPGLGQVKEEHFRLNLNAFRRWLKCAEGRAFASNAGGPSDDGLYTVSAVLRRFMPRGLSLFTFPANESTGYDGQIVLVRGFRKFTGFTSADEDEESGATEHCNDFYFAPSASASSFSVTTKSNGENGKFTVRKVKGFVLICAGSKNTCICWTSDQDVTQLYPPSLEPTAPGPAIAEKMQRFWLGWDLSTQESFVEKVSSNNWTLMLEHNSSEHEHVFPINADFVEFVAILDVEGLPLPQHEAFAFFDHFKLPRVRCETQIPMECLPLRLQEERLATDREGVVLYLEDTNGAPVGLVKVKTNFYVKARRTRQIFWNCIVDPLFRQENVDVTDHKTIGYAVAEKKLLKGMKELKHVEGCEDQWEIWANEAIGFIHWWKREYERASLKEETRLQCLSSSRNKFGTMYRDYCKFANLTGGDN